MNRCERVDAFTASLGTAESLDWMLRAGEAGLTGFAVFDDHVLWRHVHGANASHAGLGAARHYPRALKVSLDRRRAGGGEPCSPSPLLGSAAPTGSPRDHGA